MLDTLPRSALLHSSLPAVCRLGLATKGNSRLKIEDVEHAVERGINYLNWRGRADPLSRAVARSGAARSRVQGMIGASTGTKGPLEPYLASTGSG